MVFRTVTTIGCALVLGTVSGCSHAHPVHRRAGSQSPPPQPSQAPPLTDARALELGTGLTTGTAASLNPILVLPSDPAEVAAADTALAGLGAVTFDLLTFTKLGPATGTVDATVTAGGTRTKWSVRLAYQQGRWLIDGTTQP